MLRPSRLQFVAVVAALAIASVLVTGAFAGKGGNGGSGGSGASSPSLNIVWPYLGANGSGSATPVPYVVSGCGYSSSNGGVTVVVHSPEAISFAGGMPDANGCITVTNFSTQGPGSYTVDAWQTIGKKDVKLATTSFTVS